MKVDVEVMSGPFECEDTMTLVVVRDALRRVLIGRKTRGVGCGMYVLPGGKDHYWLGAAGIYTAPGPVEASAELRQETGIRIPWQDLSHVGRLEVLGDSTERSVRIYSGFTVEQPAAHPESTELEDLHFCAPSDLPYDKMLPDYAHWLPRILADEPVHEFIWI